MSDSIWFSLFGSKPSCPVKLTTDETQLIMAVTVFAMKRVAPARASYLTTEGKLPSVDRLLLRRDIYFGGSISREDLAFLAPYIDEWINGNAPPENLPAEYHDWRPDTLRSLKDRMLTEGLWPN
jgi:hypothetical protein